MNTPKFRNTEAATPHPEGFDILAHPLPESLSTLLREKRRAGLEAYKSAPFPTARDEEWRRTRPDSFPYPLLSRAGVSARREPSEAPPADSAYDVVVDIDDNGYSIRDISGAQAQGLCLVTSLEEAARSHPELVEKYLNGPAHVRGARKFASLCEAFWNFGVFINIAADARLEGGILLRYRISREGALIPRILIVAGANSRADVMEHYVSDDEQTILCVSSRETYLARGANLTASIFQEWGDNTYHIGEDWFRLERDAALHWVAALLGGKTIKQTVGCDCREEGSDAYMSGIFFADKKQHIDQSTLQLHSSPNTTSNLLYKGAVADRGHSVYQGIIAASKGAIKVDAYQMNHNLVLNDGARADSLPGLEIDADDLKCSHGATHGSLNPEHVFYLRSRGLPETEVRKMLIEGFFEDVLSRIPHSGIQERARERIREKAARQK